MVPALFYLVVLLYAIILAVVEALDNKNMVVRVVCLLVAAVLVYSFLHTIDVSIAMHVKSYL